MRNALGWMLAFSMRLLWYTCRIQFHNDPRSGPLADHEPYIFAILHAHQISATFCPHIKMGTMVSKSADGDVIVPTLRTFGAVPVRGSTRKKGQDKGGRTALAALSEHVRTGYSVCLTVDGPRGPRNHVYNGAAYLARNSNATVLPLTLVPSRRWIISRSWDRLQIPKPFSTIHGYFSEPVQWESGDSLESFRKRIETSLNTEEQKRDPNEACWPTEQQSVGKVAA